MKDGRLVYTPGFLPAADADALLAALIRTVPWQQDRVRMFGKEHPAPRLTAWFGDPGCRYTYSGTTWEPRPWTPELETIRQRVVDATDIGWNAVLVNRYRDGRDAMGWHSDDEPELGPEPWIASVSLGAARTLQLKHKHAKDEPRIDLELEHGSLLVMAPPTQTHWKHCLPRRARVANERVNLTFRVVDAR